MMERKILNAAPGMLLTNGKEFGRQILLGEHDSPENWYEVPEDSVETLPGARTSIGSVSNYAEEADYLAALRSLGVDV